ncbi:amino acid ABC transporter permease [Nakamurella flavida]|uniref:Amino acid ABC transporter permease n=1 Tax=Nakamurella flavida TaxID=363630 RepID=A0A939C029_9ACTN|nr:amino acid ABC transporter permease [Nakamurella flavida]MBM9476293.1 amino acid ABC transporter permease [Nakamurella flavida]MDP9779607.1 His/Glu/Gln/Arg/opine family amino acid ABC transporter permease subunit [Nakamurella flavida]
MEFDTTIFWDALTSQEYLDGAVLSLVLAAAAQILAVIIGFVVALGRVSKRRIPRGIAAVYVWFFRAIPTLLVLLLIWNAGPQLFPALREDWFSPFLAGLIGLAVVEAAYMAEIIRSALLSVDEGQALAARALGLTPAKVMRKVLVPQAIRVALPPTGNEFIAMIKYTSLASVISLRELLTTAQVGVSVTFRYAEYYVAALVYYLVIVSVVMALQAMLERRYRWVSRTPRTWRPGRTASSALAPNAPAPKEVSA